MEEIKKGFYMENEIRNMELAASGNRKIDWVEPHMPVLKSICEDFRKTRPFEGLKVALSVHLEAKTAYLACVFKAGGADVYATGSNVLSTQDDVAAGLASRGIHVFAWHGATEEEYRHHLSCVLSPGPNIIIDDGGDLVNMMHHDFPGLIDNVIGGCEETTTGIIRLIAMDRAGKLKFPMMLVNDAEMKHLFDNRYGTGQSVWNAINKTTNLIAAGKQVVDIGGYEYDRAPIDLYFCSEFWNNVPCYAWGASVAYQLTAADKLRFQVCESPYRQLPAFSHEDLYSYNLMWYGSHGPWSTMWSVNMMERTDGHYISYIALGNELRLSDRLRLELDLMNRAADHQTYFLRDCSVIGELSYRPTAKWNIYAKASYDVNRPHTAADQLVMAGTELTRVGGGLEFFPLGDGRVRLHANYCYSFGTNANPAGTMLDRQSLVDVGLTWRVKVIGN